MSDPELKSRLLLESNRALTWLLSPGARRAVSLGALLAVSLIPLVGVLAWGWDVGAIVVLYWSENLILGLFTIVKMLSLSPAGGLFSILFFLIHYGGFCAVHGVFVLVLTLGEHSAGGALGNLHWPFVFVFVELLVNVVWQVLQIAPPEWIIGFGALFVSHGISLVVNYYLGGEYREQTVRSLMTAPYKRILVLHVAIIGGGFGVVALGSPLPLLALLVVLKTVLDVYLHRREHRQAGD